VKNVLVTGAGKRLGRAIALDLAAAGWNVAIHHKNSKKEAEAVAAEVESHGVKALLIYSDLRFTNGGIVDAAASEMGPLTALINSASIFENDDWQSATQESWETHMDINLRAPFVLSQAFAKQLPDGEQGSIVNIIDQRVLKPTPQFLSYSLSKAGLHWLTTTLAQGMAPRIRVNAVGPGPTLRNERQSHADFDRQRGATLLGHGADPADICAAVRYLLDAPSVTGQMIAVDGGQHLIWQTPDVMGKE
jgi:NAD(P)-dependent dehydrogenase (short-subunit alcohol dehydrogenase family)